ncbi:MAG: hypothetical protein ACR2RV_16085 [Verrucomicrobiales bacterium]
MPLCNIRQLRISSALDDGRALSAPLQRHVDACPRCRQFLEQSESLEIRLSDSPPNSAQTPAWMRTRIMAEVRASTPEHAHRARPAWLPTAAGIAATAILVGLITMSTRQDEVPEQETASVQISTPVTPLHPATVPGRFERHAKQALSTEFQNLATDISGARRFISASLRNTIPGLGGE